MLPLISKHRLYVYLLFFIFLSSIFNFKLLESYKDKFSLKNINVSGLPDYEKKIIEIELNNLKNINIFKLDEDHVLDKLKNFKFLEQIYVNKIIPSSISINLSKTTILGKTLIDGEIFYVGKNGKFINSNQIFQKKEFPLIFGKFKVNDFLNLYEILKSYQIDLDKVKKYYYYKNKRWDLSFSDGLKLMLPSNNIEESLNIFKKLLDTNNLENIKIIDLRINNQIILTNNE